MKYDIIFNRTRNLFMVWRTIGNNSEVVKTFKTQAAAEKWIARQ